ncbi:MAG: hypothetical protein IKH12_11490, partial [Clostridia bacterium]|nr:hypothetical protein [Clostridia bacterium]
TRDQVKFDDGIFELNLAKLPKNASEWLEVSKDVLISHTYNPKFFTLSKGSHFIIESLDGQEIPWTLDGEYGGSFKITEIDCIQNAFRVYRS